MCVLVCQKLWRNLLTKEPVLYFLCGLAREAVQCECCIPCANSFSESSFVWLNRLFDNGFLSVIYYRCDEFEAVIEKCVRSVVG